MKKIKKINLKINTKKRLLVSFLSASVILVPIITTSALLTNQSNFIFNLNGVNFKSFDEAKKYVLQNSTINNEKIEGYSSSWKANINGQEENFSSTKDLWLKIYDEYITTRAISSTVDLSQYENEWGQIVGNDVWENIYSAAEKSSMVYQGYNDVLYDTEKKAYDSYFFARNSFYFNGIFFEYREDLKKYLLTEFLPNKNLNPNNSNTIILKGPNGITSAAIDLTKTSAIDLISSFISNNAIKNSTYINSKNGQSYLINNSNLDNIISNVNLDDLDYIKMNSNQGNSRCVVDNDLTDSSNLIGPYFYEGTLDIGSFLNKDMWKKVQNVSKQKFQESKIDSMIGSFFSSIINDDSALILSEANNNGRSPVLFRTLLLDTSLNSYDEWFLSELNNLSPALFEAVTVANIELLKGKKYNTFYKIPILYNFLMQRIISWGLNEDVIKLVNSYFSDVCDFIQDSLELIIIDKKLLLSKDGKKTFNVKEFFNIGNKNFDFNSSIEFYLNNLKKEYPNLIAAMSSYIASQTNITSFASLIPFEGVNLNYLIDFSIITQQELDSILPSLKNIYNVFSEIKYNDMVILYIKSSNDPIYNTIKAMPENVWVSEFEKLYSNYTSTPISSILKAIGTKNSTYFTMAESALISEIQLYNSTGRMVKYGYLHKIYSDNKALNKLPLFVEFYNKFQNEISPFRAYLGFLIDKKFAGDIINNQTTSSVFSFTQALIRMSLAFLGTSALVANTARGIYNSGSYDVNRYSNRRGIFNDNTISNQGTDLTSLKSPTDMPIVDLINDKNKISECYINSNGEIVDLKSRANVDPNNLGARPKVKKINLDNNDKLLEIKNDDAVADLIKEIQSIAIVDETGIFVYGNREFNQLTVKERIKLLDKIHFGNELKGEKLALMPNIDAIASKRIAMSSDGMNDYLIDSYLKAKYPGINNAEIDWIKNSNVIGEDAAIDFMKDFDKYFDTSMEDNFIGNNSNSNQNPSNTNNNKKPVKPNFPTGNTSNPSNSKPTSRPQKPAIFDENGNLISSPEPIFDNKGNLVNKPKAPDSSKKDFGLASKFKNKNFANWKDIKNKLSSSTPDVPNWFKSRYEDFSSRTSSWWSGAKTKFNVDSLTRSSKVVLDYSLEIFGSLALAFEFAFIIYDLFKVSAFQDFYVYTAIDGTEWIWDGGKTTSKYFGFEVKQVSGIENMVLTNPVQITLPQIEEFYYYNCQRYYDPKELIKDQLSNIITTDYIPKSGAFTNSYTLTNNGDNAYLNSANSIEELVNLVISDIGITKNSDGSFDTTNLNEKSKFLDFSGSTISSGVIVGSSDFTTLANNISSMIRSSKIAIIPDLVNGVANGKISTPFTYPGNYWDGNKVVIQDPSKYEGKIIFDNSANEFKNSTHPNNSFISNDDFVINNPITAENESTNNLYSKFVSSFSVAKKEVLGNEKNKNKFSDASSLKVNSTLYSLNINGKEVYFLNEQKLEQYLIKFLNITKILDESSLKTYTFNGNKFYSEKELDNWILSNKIYI